MAQRFVSNIPSLVQSKVFSNLHLVSGHPICIVKERIYQFFRQRYPQRYQPFDHLNPYVSLQQNFTELNITSDHPSTRATDTYYETPDTVLRTHTSAHQTELLRSGADSFLVTGPCFRRDTVDASHYPVFHQMEGVRVFEASSQRTSEDIGKELKRILGELQQHLLGPEVQIRWKEDSFPFTFPSWELEVKAGTEGEWLEVLGCGVMHPRVLARAHLEERSGWAFGQGLERLAMILFKIPDIRLFWSSDERFLSQFRGVDPQGPLSDFPTFVPFSVYPSTTRDVAFWVSDSFNEHDFHEIARTRANDLLEDLSKIDTYIDPKTGNTALCYRLTYRSMERTLETSEVNDIQNDIRNRVQSELNCQLR